LRLLRKIVNLVVSIGLLSPLVACFLAIDLIQSLHQIRDALHLPALDSSFGDPSASFVQATFLSGFMLVVVFAIGMMRIATMTIREIDDFADPPESIKRLEARINALRINGSAQKTA
jgi:hypothetical protein